MRLHAEAAARLQPDHAYLQFNAALAWLRCGEFERGWQQYRWHEALPLNHDLFRAGFPEWNGEPVAGRTFLLVGEQGLGDQLQFLQMAAWLHRQGAIVDVWVDASLGAITAGATGVHAAWTSCPPGEYDFWCRMLQMPARMKLKPSMLPLAMPYLHPDEEQRRLWSARLDAVVAPARTSKKTKRIGLVWAGNPDYELDRYRSIPLALLLPILALPDAQWFSLQMGRAKHEADNLPADLAVHALGPEITSFGDTLAILQSLDLLITVDTSVAHLAGGSALPVWVLLPVGADWRWSIERSDSPWYPSVRLFRQREFDRWDTVVDDVSLALREFIAN